eukprot:477140_1
MSSDPLSSHLSTLDWLLSIMFLGFCALLCSLVVTLLMSQVFNDKQQVPQKAVDRISKLFLISCAIVSSLDVFADLSRHIYCYGFEKDLYSYPINNIMGSADWLYYFGSVLFYLIAISRLQISFYSTQYSINCRIVSFFYTLIAATFILGTFYSIIVFISPPSPANDYTHRNFWSTYDTIPMIMLGIIDFILNTCLLILFISKLNELTSSNVLHCDVNTLKNRNTDIFKTLSKLYMIMTRHSILFTFAIIANQIWYIAVLIQLNFDNVRYGMTTFCFRALGNTVNCIVLFLSFKSNVGIYLCICGCCHRGIQKCFIKNLKSKLYKGFNNKRNNDKFYHGIIGSDIDCNINTASRVDTNEHMLINSSTSNVHAITSFHSTNDRIIS